MTKMSLRAALIFSMLSLALCFPSDLISNERSIENEKDAQSHESAKPKIVGGTTTLPMEFPWLTLLSTSATSAGDRTSRMCGGSLIHPNYVMTAAHCIRPVKIYVSIQRWDLSRSDEGEERFPIEKAYIHPNYRTNADDSPYDIALLKLNGTSKIQPIPIANENHINFTLPDTTLTVAGWGKLQYAGNNFPNKMQKVSVPVTTLPYCRSAYPTASVSDLQICAGDVVNGGEDSCQGDSGGPLFHDELKPIVMGIVSFGRDCATARYPGVYTNVLKMRSWIHTIIPESELYQYPDDKDSGSMLQAQAGLLISLVALLFALF
eukprot:TRINITY_DN4323_c0_g2_i1.p1 TRINITY_DN4323_c0_g2~~TRINITY_DN4323_c0_g2_i1.p1  ORF type:complete len:320 (-),score=52.25 TRINITY_DN4323_c0_g2_i1:293-1252(-)